MRVTQSHPIPLARRDRFYSLVQLFGAVSGLDGLVAECGCFRGLSSYLLCRALKHADENFNGHGHGYRMIVSDDYSWPGARKALDEFCGKADIALKTNRHNQAWIDRGA